MSHRKTAASALTAVALVTGIGFAWAQTEQNQPTDPMAAATAATPTSEQTPADVNAATTTPATPIDSSSQLQQTQPVDDMNRQAQPLNSSTTPLPNDSRSTMDNSATTSSANSYGSATSTTDAGYEPAPRADRN